MDHSSHITDRQSAVARAGMMSERGPQLSVVTSPLRLAQPAECAPDDWSAALAQLLDWLGIAVEFVPAARSRRLPRMTDWALAASNAVPAPPVFSPWIGWSPAAFQHGGLAGLPLADFAASYLIDHARGAAARQGGFDLMLLSPHPAQCPVDEDCGVPLPRAGLMRRMIRAAHAEGRERLAIIVHARQRNALACQLLAAGKGPSHEAPALDIVTIEQALPALMAGSPRWDAIIAMPDVRSIVFTLLSEVSGVRKAWPMMWHGRGLRLAGCEIAGEGLTRIPLDAPALIHALALVLHEGGVARGAWRLYAGWAQLRDSGVTTSGRGGDAPYLTQVSDSDFITMLCKGAAVSKRDQPPWRAIKIAQTAISGSQSPLLRVVS